MFYRQFLKGIEQLVKASTYIEKDLHDVIMSVVPKLSTKEVEEYLLDYEYDVINDDPYVILSERLEDDILGITV